MTLVDSKFYLEIVNAGPWKPSSGGYAIRTVGKRPNRRTEYLHQFVAKLLGIESMVDHKNLDGLDNREENLRPASYSQNNANQRIRSDNTSGVKGVCWDVKSRKWVSIDGVNHRFRL